jgi:long-chain acyl-CoA synthetase
MQDFDSEPIRPDRAVTLDELFHERARRSTTALAYRYWHEADGAWRDLNWGQMLDEIARWQAALDIECLQPGERVAILLKNCPAWVMFDQAALGLGLVTVPLYTSDRPENVAHILRDSGARLLLIDNVEHWPPLQQACQDITSLTRVVAMRGIPEPSVDPRLRSIDQWLPMAGDRFRHHISDPQAIATIVYTSGTTGKSKGVMLSHSNLLSNAWASLQTFHVRPDDLLFSFLPLSHCLERLAGYYLPIMAGAAVAYARSFQTLQDDLLSLRPTVLITVPRIFERIRAGLYAKLEQGPSWRRRLFELAVDIGYQRFEHKQRRGLWRPRFVVGPLLDVLVARQLHQRLGGRLRLAVSGGAALPPDTARIFIGLGLPLLQGYGMTEASPVISVNRIDDNLPASVGRPIPGVEVRLGKDKVLEIRGPNVMRGYWNNDAATRAMFTADGWLVTGDVAHIDSDGHISITGRIKEILVLSNGEKVPPADLEAAILNDPLFEQVMVVGEGQPYLGLLAVVNRERWQLAAQQHALGNNWPDCLRERKAQAYALASVTRQMKGFPGHARVRRIALLHEPWSLEDGLLTPTLKLKRASVLEHYQVEFDQLYK